MYPSAYGFKSNNCVEFSVYKKLCNYVGGGGGGVRGGGGG